MSLTRKEKAIASQGHVRLYQETLGGRQVIWGRGNRY